MSTSNLDKNLNLSLLILRIAVGVIFILAGWGKLNGIEGIAGFFGNVGIPLAGIMAWVVALVEFLGGILVLIGYKIRIPSILLAIVMVVAILMVKMGGEFDNMRIDISLLAMTIALSLVGSGDYSVDSKVAGGSSDL
ncbi:MAG: DoxX family protein [Balneolaceae bacterium]